MLKIASLKKRISETFELSIDNLKLDEGEIVAIIGNNGSGKTLLLNSILNNISLDSGNIEIYMINNKLEKWKKITGVYVNKNYLLDFMTPIEFFKFIGSFYNISIKDIHNKLENYQYFLGFEHNTFNNKVISKLSRGTKDKIGIIAALFIEPKLLILDEPFSHLDTPASLNLLELLNSINKQFKTTQIITSPDLNNLSVICTRIILMEKGTIKYNFPNNLENLSIINKYLRLDIYDKFLLSKYSK
jgi:ABC-2 type transport system ATP-binding protein